MPAGNGVNCLYCPEREVGRCEGNDTGCLCFKCPRHLGQCRCVKYCRETESVLIFDLLKHEQNKEVYKSYLIYGLLQSFLPSNQF